MNRKLDRTAEATVLDSEGSTSLHEEMLKVQFMQKYQMKFSDSLNVNIFILTSALNLFVVCGEALFARPDTITNATAGEQVMFPLQYQDGEDQYDVTFRLRFPLAFKILTWKSNNPEKLHIVHPLYQHRVQIHTGFVVLYNVQVNDTGEYEIQIDYYGTELKNRDQSTFRMQVSEPVSQPVIEILGNCVSAPNITLSCSVSKGTNVIIHWEKVSLSGVLNETYDVALLVIDCVTEEQQHAYRCIAENPVSNITSNRVTIDLHKGTNPNGNRTHLMILIPVVLAVLVSSIVYLCSALHSKTDMMRTFVS
ncbi:hepatic and glial cell adhesion molecule-like isoform X2 [Heterodontus francisci]|uniref:hepatic and glial cell adhesion molecule-like isoform X2 n=1 Tax=Heterodontus francisci TaxID=7792 RepID=UPI00355B7DF0